MIKKMRDSSTDTVDYVHIEEESLNSAEMTQRWKKWKGDFVCVPREIPGVEASLHT